MRRRNYLVTKRRPDGVVEPFKVELEARRVPASCPISFGPVAVVFQYGQRDQLSRVLVERSRELIEGAGKDRA